MPKNTRKHLTKRQCENEKPRIGGRFILWDDDPIGLGLRVTPSGAKSWVLVYRVNGEQNWLTLANVPANEPELARKAAKLALGAVVMERDPAQEARDKKIAERGADRFKVLTDRYLADPEVVRHRTVGEMQRLIAKHLLPVWQARKVKDITSAEILALYERVAATAPVGANRLLSIIRRLFKFAVRKQIISHNPAATVEKSKENNKHHRAATDDELRKLWIALDAEPALLASAYKLIALTGCRRGEVWDAQWSEFDLDNQLWTIPAARTKNHTAHRLPLVGQALEIITALKAGAPTGEYVFPATANRKDAYQLCQLHLRVCRAAAVANFEIHGLRSTVSTGLANLGLSGEIISRVLNHTVGREGSGSKITLVYNQASYDKPKRAALELWDAHVHQLTVAIPDQTRATA